MPIGDLPDDLVDHLRTEFGDYGQRAVEFLHTAATLLEADEPALPRRPECIAYCLREAMETLPKSSGVRGGGEWRSRSRTVEDAKLRFEQIRQLPGTDADAALRNLLESIDSMASTRNDESIHQKRLIAVMVVRTGVEPLAVGTDPVSDYQNLIKRLNDSVHGHVTLEEVRVFWDNTRGILSRLFLPPDARHEELNSDGGNQ
jgi:hypothetical protein